jgi:hypothetical protein
MNRWMGLSIEYANQRSYLDDLFHVYPTIPDGIREIDNELWRRVEAAFAKRENLPLLETLLEFDLFPIKDCGANGNHVAILRKDLRAMEVPYHAGCSAENCGRQRR